MNLIPCSENCAHQRDGYCGCDEVGVVSQQLGPALTGCIYFSERRRAAEATTSSLTEDFKRLSDI